MKSEGFKKAMGLFLCAFLCGYKIQLAPRDIKHLGELVCHTLS